LYNFDPSLILEEDAKCAICLGDYEEEEQLRDLPCGHHFHKFCVDQWLMQKKHCPLCLQNIETAKEFGQRSLSDPNLEKRVIPAPSIQQINVENDSDSLPSFSSSASSTITTSSSSSSYSSSSASSSSTS